MHFFPFMCHTTIPCFFGILQFIAFCAQAKRAIDVEVYCQPIIV